MTRATIDHEVVPAAARGVLASFLAEREQERRHVVVSLSGAHAYGFLSPDSDFDLKAIHVAHTPRLLGLAAPAPTADRTEVRDGHELDYTSNELHMSLVGMLKGNGNYLERVLGVLPLVASDELASLRPLIEGSLSRRVFHHYQGFATSKQRDYAREPSAKRALYVLRTALTGAQLLDTGRMVIDVNELLDGYGFGEARELIATKRAGERVVLAEADAARWTGALTRAFEVLETARQRSVLPDAPPNEPEIDEWLLEVRRRRW